VIDCFANAIRTFSNLCCNVLEPVNGKPLENSRRDLMVKKPPDALEKLHARQNHISELQICVYKGAGRSEDRSHYVEKSMYVVIIVDKAVAHAKR